MVVQSTQNVTTMPGIKKVPNKCLLNTETYAKKTKETKIHLVSQSRPTRLMTTLLCSSALRMEFLSLASHSCNSNSQSDENKRAHSGLNTSVASQASFKMGHLL
jgi:hypothetical protein